MNIDLFLTAQGECGLLCSSQFESLPAGVIFDAETLELTTEFVEDAPFHLNITAEEELKDRILMTKKLYVGFLENGMIADTLVVPLLYLNDPYGSDFSGGELSPPNRSIEAFGDFMKRCTVAQPIHRDDLGDEDSSGSVLRGMDPKQLEFVPQLIRQRMLEAAPSGPSGPSGPAGVTYEQSLGMGMSPKGPGGMGGGSGMQRRVVRQQPPKKSDDED